MFNLRRIKVMIGTIRESSIKRIDEKNLKKLFFIASSCETLKCSIVLRIGSHSYTLQQRLDVTPSLLLGD